MRAKRALGNKCPSGVKQSMLSRLEGGSRPNPTADIVRKLARALGCTADYLLGMYEDDESEHVPTAEALIGV
jgi:transcriptional regulator with XRE-family HTH domain